MVLEEFNLGHLTIYSQGGNNNYTENQIDCCTTMMAKTKDTINFKIRILIITQNKTLEVNKKSINGNLLRRNTCIMVIRNN